MTQHCKRQKLITNILGGVVVAIISFSSAIISDAYADRQHLEIIILALEKELFKRHTKKGACIAPSHF